MYLASLKNGSTLTYQIRQSYRHGAEDTFRSRLVYDLGPDPRRLFEVYNDYVVLFNDDLLTAVAAAGDNEGYLLEQLLWRFLPREIRQRLRLFGSRFARRPSPLSAEEHHRINRQIHLFDRRRLYYLRYGAVDQSRIARMNEKCCRPLLDTSRDEREFYFAAEETALSSGYYLQYVYAIFDIQKHFPQSFAPWFPEALPWDEVADHFLYEICRLNGDDRFWQGEIPGDGLHPHLRRYLIMLFDYRPAARSFQAEFARAFRDGHRRFRWPKRAPARPPEKVSEIFATPYDQLQKMSREQLSRLYRKKAMDLHPDRGGDHNLFIELTEVYESLQHLKK